MSHNVPFGNEIKKQYLQIYSLIHSDPLIPVSFSH